MQFSRPVAMDVALKIADAVNYMHSNNPIVVHQDLKPQNVLVSACRFRNLGAYKISYLPVGECRLHKHFHM